MPSVNSYKTYEWCAIILTFSMIYAVPELCGSVIKQFLLMSSLAILIIVSLPYLKRDLNFFSLFYCFGITLGFLFHRILGVDETGFFGEVLLRVVPVLIIVHYKYLRVYDCKKVRVFALIFFVLECLVAICERLTLSHFISYESDTQAMNSDMDFDEDFRSFSLMAHPLYNANVVSFFLAFIMCSKTIRKIPKISLMFLGFGAIWAFNSRACMLMWLLIIVYRLFFYGKSLKWMVTSVIALLFFLPSVFLFVQNSGMLGRLDFDFSDGSTLTRIWAFQIFFEHPWSLQEIIMGGTILYYPGILLKGALDYPLLENGVLMDLGYWGFILGPIKIIGELMISYFALYQFNPKDKFIIMVSIWGVAMMNNNSYASFLMVFYMCAFLAFGVNANIVDNNPTNRRK